MKNKNSLKILKKKGAAIAGEIGELATGAYSYLKQLDLHLTHYGKKLTQNG